MKKLLPLLLLFISQVSFAQFNLVPNPSFELYDTCPFDINQINYAPPWNNPLIHSTPDYMNVCDSITTNHLCVPNNYAGYETAHTGNAYAAIVTYTHDLLNPAINNYREYIQAQLLDTLIANVNYCIRFYVSACDSVRYISNDIGVYFSSTPLNFSCFDCPIPVTPQFENLSTNSLNSRNGWTLVSGNYIATGGEKYIVIGNFKDSTSTVATYTGWSHRQIQCFAEYYIDDVLLAPCDSLNGIKESEINLNLSILPNPSENYFVIKSKRTLIKSVFLYDMLGNLIYTSLINSNETSLNLESQYNGIYILKVLTNNNFYQFKLIKQ